ncbi:hypothetical protein VVD49_06360 [Uliginosibacterium sp. H3]|uniref:Contractile injection system tube protein N-terminal domain-containing protein n=1 Tax=Uliginosibacterium silvisoli TaxID=3114758 RepID=A0ABU6K075_9RHOO|nr:hypothetical protein [Uliginosibacterium sp. H3]
MPMLPDIPTVEKATFKVLEGTGAGGDPFPVQFNPASLEYTLSNEFDDKGSNAARQFVKKTSGKLTMTLVFDTTDTGGDVREQTEKISRLLEPAKDGKKKFAPKVEFGWGTYAFKGVVEQYKETIDFFAASGVPLRASINLTLSSQEVEFQSKKNPAASVDGDPGFDPVSAPAGAGPADVANAMGDPRAARSIAGANGSDSLRFGGSASLSVGGEISLSAAASFSVGASAGIGAGIGGGVGVGVGVGAGIGIGGGIGISGGAGVSAGAGVSVGGGLSIQATAGEAFTGLRVSPPSLSVSVGDARAALLPAAGVSGAASFGPGGRARVQSGGSLSADVGASADLNARIGFD